ncbi:MAG: hypothetical protein SO297_14960 [Clostridium paraputrificum]|nr:hypothetical protein [Clostridium paraputrificum]MDY4723229.1 hypothetical protein [Clostridium paraputrificum]
MKSEDLHLNLLKSIQSFEENYKETLNKANTDDKTVELLYDLGADIKHCFDSFMEQIVEYTKDQ